MKITDFISSLYYSFFSRSFYRSVARARKGLCFSHLLLILCIFWVPEISQIQLDVKESLSNEAPKYIKQVPIITVEQGKASIREHTPYYINYPEKKAPFAIIDTSGQITSLDKTGALILLTKTQFIIKKNAAESRTFDLAGIDKLTIDERTLNEWIDTFTVLFPFVLFPFVLFFSFLYYLIQVLLSAGIGSFIAKKFRTELDFRALIRLSVISFTPAILLQTVHSVLGIPFPYRAPLSLLIALGYLYYGIGANSEAHVSNPD